LRRPVPGGDLATLEKAIDAEIAKLLVEGVVAAEVDRVKQRMIAEAIYARDSLSTAVRVFGSALTTGSSVEEVEAWPEKIAAVTPADVQAVAKLVFNRDQSVTAHLVPARGAAAVPADGTTG